MTSPRPKSAPTREVVGTFLLGSNASKDRIKGVLYHGLRTENLADVEGKWRDEFGRRDELAKSLGKSDWRDEDAKWDWRRKYRSVDGLLEYEWFALELDNTTEGLLCVHTGIQHLCRHPSANGKPLGYVELLATAPWNRPDARGTPGLLRGVGQAMFVTAIEVSKAEDFEGRLGLHSLTGAEEFYARVCGMEDYGPDPDHNNYKYFELSAENAARFQNRYSVSSEEGNEKTN